MKRLFFSLLLSLLLAIGFYSYPIAFSAQRSSIIIIFNANWCASCREVIPIIEEVALQNHIQVQVIDVDDQNAPTQARHYGLNIPSAEPPQAYLLINGTVALIYDGKNYRYGQLEAVRTTVLQNLQRHSSSAGASGR